MLWGSKNHAKLMERTVLPQSSVVMRLLKSLAPQINVVLNWFEELKQRVPVQ